MEDDANQDLAYTRSLGERLRAVRRGLGLSLEAVDRASNREFKDSALSSYERGDRTISVPRLRRLAELYGTTVDDLLPKVDRRSGGDAPETIDLRDAVGSGQTGASPSEVEVADLAIRRLQALAAAAQDLADEAGHISGAVRSLIDWVAVARSIGPEPGPHRG